MPAPISPDPTRWSPARATTIRVVSDVERFEFAFAPSYARASRPFGITPNSAWVSIDDVLLDARF